VFVFAIFDSPIHRGFDAFGLHMLNGCEIGIAAYQLQAPPMKNQYGNI